MCPVSLKPKDAVETQGLLDDVDVKIVDAKFELWDYNGKIATPVPALKLSLSVKDDPEVHHQFFSAGKTTDWIPSEDGKQLNAVGTNTSLNASSNAALVLKSIVESGFPENKIGSDVGVFIGMCGHINRLPAPKRPGLKRTTESEYEPTVLCFTRIDSIPGDSTKGTSTAGTDVSKNLEEETTAILMEMIVESGGTLKKAAIPTKLFTKAKGNPNKTEMMALVFKDDFLKKGPWTYADGVLTLA